MNRLALEELAPAPGDHVLEVGFGGGDLLRSLLGAGTSRVVGLEVSDTMLARAGTRFRSEVGEGRLEFLRGPVEKLPLPDRCFDRACSVNSIYFWQDLPRAFRELARVIRPGGKLTICFQTPEAVRSWPGHIHGFIPYEVAEVAERLVDAGFGDVRAGFGSDRNVGEFVCLVSERT
jgi:ubiquinone/menaquinone biosynthesis C-methylase UbiE